MNLTLTTSMFRACALAVTILISLAVCSQEFSGKKGIIDFDNWDIENSPIQMLDGEWEFYWNELFTPEDLSAIDSSSIEYRDCHINWNKYTINGKSLDAIGFATYRIHLINIPKGRLNLCVRNTLCACKVYIDNELVTEVGKVGRTKEETIPCWEDRIIPLPVDKTDLVITVQLANFHHRNGGFNDPFYIGKEEAIYGLQREQIMLNGFEASSFLFAGFFFITLFIFRKKDNTLLFFALFCLTVALRPFVSVNYMVYSIFPDINWHVLIHLEYLTLFLPSAFILLFIKERFPDQSPKKLLTGLSVFMFIEAFASLFLPATIFSWLVIPHQFLAIISFVIIFIVIAKAIKDRVNGALFGGIAILCLLSSAALTIVLYMDLVEPMPYLFTTLQLGFILSMSLILGSKFSSQFKKVEYLQITTEEQRAKLEIQNHIVEEKNQEITSSISYAYRIQKAILPPDNLLSDIKADSFILYKPKDIVAGDFYWVEQKNNLLFFAAADCTGHGVPGAMVSVICNSALNRCIREFGLTDPGTILNKTRHLVIETFEKSDEEVKDGMDIALCVLNLDTNEIKFSGANNPLWIVRSKKGISKIEDNYDRSIENENNELLEFKGDKQPIGTHYKPVPFKTIGLQLSKGETIYLFSDGYSDQFGGEKGKKFMHKNFKNLILENSDKSLVEQENILGNYFEKWRGSIEQTDDVCIIGLKI